MPGKEILNPSHQEQAPKKALVSARSSQLVEFLEEASIVSLDKKLSPDQKFPPQGWQTDEQYYRGFEFLGHTIGIGRSVRATGKLYNTSHANVQDIRNRRIRLLYKNADPALQAKYSPEVLGITERERTPEGKKKLSKPARKLRVRSGRRDMIGRPKFAEYKDEQARIDTINNYQLTEMLKLKDPPVVLISDVARLEGATFFMRDVKFFAEDFKSARIAAGAVLRSTRVSSGGERIPSYSYIIWAQDLARARNRFRISQALSRFINKYVDVIGPSPKRVPNIYKLEESGEYIAIGALIKELRGRSYGFSPSLTMRDLITDEPPAAIYHFQDSYMCHKSNIKAISPFIAERLRVLNLL